MIENNGVYGLTRPVLGVRRHRHLEAKKGDVNQQPPIDPVMLAMNLGATFVARSFGRQGAARAMIQAGLIYPGFALIDILRPASPSTTTKS